MNEDSLYNRLAKGILTDEEIDNLVDEIMNIPVEKNNNCLSSYGSINVDDLIDSIKELRKVPTYDELLRGNKQLKEQLQQKENIISKAKEFVKKHNERAGKLYYKYNNKYLLSEIKEDLLEILDNKGE